MCYVACYRTSAKAKKKKKSTLFKNRHRHRPHPHHLRKATIAQHQVDPPNRLACCAHTHPRRYSPRRGATSFVVSQCGRTVFLSRRFCAIWQIAIVTTRVGFVLFGKISQIHVTFAAIYHNSNKSLITFVLLILRVISTIHGHFSEIFTNSSKKLD